MNVGRHNSSLKCCERTFQRVDDDDLKSFSSALLFLALFFFKAAVMHDFNGPLWRR